MLLRINKQGWFIMGTLVVVFFMFYASNRRAAIISRRDTVSIRKLLIACVHLSEDAGIVIQKNYASSKLNTRIKQSAGGPKNELVTDIDLASHTVIVSGLKRLFSGIEIVSEEHPPVSSTASTSNVVANYSDVASQLPDTDMFVHTSDLAIWVDPLDATQELTEGLLEYVTVMICVALRGNPIIGVIHQPFLNRTYWSWNSYDLSNTVMHALTDRVKLTPITDDPKLAITYSRSHLDNTTEQKISAALSPQKVVFVPAGGSGFKALSLIIGTAQLYVHPSATRRWDICAPHALLEAAGGRMTGLDGSQLLFSADAPPVVSSATGLFAASSVPLHRIYSEKLAALLSKPS